MKYATLILVLFFSAKVLAQGPPPPPPPPPPAVIVAPSQVDTSESLSFAEEMPQFPGGESAFHLFLKNNVHYPDSAKKYGREGTVYVYFEIGKGGEISN